ncbi:hypothetical protein EJ04DRAFT_553238 [Polyplosphaeria fusca]|uniref:Uncharacterized protein n=1 Tax=Polyplosphaeria fusca TaxID=682080 RepID=A0A9P4V2V1_9PLEO|nr:hypothetical protein EJ04DRAFT_553238 [Polyplosphaeria fusca]
MESNNANRGGFGDSSSAAALQLGNSNRKTMPHAPPQTSNSSPPQMALRYARALGDLDNPFVNELREMYNIPRSGKGWNQPDKLSDIHPTFSNLHGNFISNTPMNVDWSAAYEYRHHTKDNTQGYELDVAEIQTVLKDPEAHVELLYESMMNCENVKDNPNSKDVKNFKSGSHDQQKLQSACRKILLDLIHRLVIGYFGPPHKNDTRLLDRRMGCEERFMWTCLALREFKSICRDALEEDSKTIILVNQAVHTMKQKEQQKKSNNKRAEAMKQIKAELEKSRRPPPDSSQSA